MTTEADLARCELAPHGVLRAALNDANFLLVRREAGENAGLAPALCRELASRLELDLAFVNYADAGAITAALHADRWDIALMGIDADRAGIAFTDPYVEIEAGYLVPAGSAIETLRDVDQPGVRVSVAARSAYDLFLTRTLASAVILRAETIEGSYQRFNLDHLEVLAGLRPRLLEDARRQPGSRVLDGSFMVVRQGIGTPASRTRGAAFLRQFVTDAKSSGLLATLLAGHGMDGLAIP